MQGANNNIGLTAGDCVNVAAGTYDIRRMISLTKGGNANQANGYVTYVGAPKHGSVITYKNRPYFGLSIKANYLILDGFEFNGNGLVTDILVQAGLYQNTPYYHHIMVLYNIVHDSWVGGIGLGTGDYFVIAGNVVYNTSSRSIHAESGIGVYEPVKIPGFSSDLPWDNQTYHIQVLQNVCA